MADVAVKVDSVTKIFKLPHERQSSLKSRVINFRKRGYELQKALDNISFEVKKGEFFGIVGRNGSGKSTLLKLIAGIYVPTKGAVSVNGSLTPFIELGVGFNPELSGRENVYLNGSLLGFNRKEMLAMYRDIVEFAELEKFMDQKLKNYSSGMKVRLAFSIAIRAHSDILLIDEVLAVGDAAFQKKCYNYFDQLKKEKKTVVFVSHSMEQVVRFCDRAILMGEGQIQYDGTASEASLRYMLDSSRQTTASKDTDQQQKSDSIEFINVSMNRKSEKYSLTDVIGLTIKYRIKKSIKYDLAISIQKNGVSLHEKNTKDITLPSANGMHEIVWEAPADYLIPGLYRINIAAFTGAKFELVAFVNDAAGFYIEGTTENTGGMMDMKGKWQVKDK